MTKNIKYTCTCCGEIHEEWPALSYLSPSNYDNLSDLDKREIAELQPDFCTISYPDQIDNFIRCTLTQKVNDHCEDLEYGLWVSLSDASFQDYSDNFTNVNYEVSYFGWLANELPDYNFKESIPTTVFTRTDGFRPEIIPHKDFDHPFVYDYYNGISKLEAEKRINDMIEKIKK